MSSPPVGFDLHSKGKGRIWKSFRGAKQHIQTSNKNETHKTQIRVEAHPFLILFFLVLETGNIVFQQITSFLPLSFSLCQFSDFLIQSPALQYPNTNIHITVDDVMG